MFLILLSLRATIKRDTEPSTNSVDTWLHRKELLCSSARLPQNIIFIVIMSETVIAKTNSGPVRGRRREGPTGQTFYSFQNIPYAKAPVGELRFKVGLTSSLRAC